MNSYMEKKQREKKTQMIATADGDINQTQSLPTVPVTIQSNTLTMDAHVTIPTTLPAPSNGEQSNIMVNRATCLTSWKSKMTSLH